MTTIRTFDDNRSFTVNDLESDFNTIATTPVSVLVLCVEAGGFGDIVFGIKFVKYLLNSFPLVYVTIMTDDKGKYVDFIEKGIGVYMDQSRENRVEVIDIVTQDTPYYFLFQTQQYLLLPGSIRKNKTINNTGIKTITEDTYSRLISNDRFRRFVQERDDLDIRYLVNYNNIEWKQVNWILEEFLSHFNRDIYPLEYKFMPEHQYNVFYITPDIKDLTIIFIGNYAYKNVEKLYFNSYKFSEYNSSGRGGFLTGIGNNDLGLMLNSYDSFLPISKHIEVLLNDRRFSIAYFYTDMDNACKMPEGECDETGGNECYETGKYACIMKNLTKCLVEYIETIKTLRINDEDIVIISKRKIFDSIITFIDNYSGNDRDINYYKQDFSKFLKDKKWVDPASTLSNGITIIDFCAMSQSEMRGLYQRSLPTVFVSGDQSITDFISVNKYFTKDIFYQIFNWKKSLASGLGVTPPDSTCGRISREKLKQIKDNPNHDFRLNGLKVVESTLVFSLSEVPLTGCNYFGYIRQLNTSTYSELIQAFTSHEEDLLYSFVPERY